MGNSRFLRSKERDALDFVLPAESPGYNEYRNLIADMIVVGHGRRGEGNFILGKSGDTPDRQSPLAPVVAYGVIETTLDSFTITVREHSGQQIDVEIVGSQGEEIPDHFEEKRRWTYSRWKPGDPSPGLRNAVREVDIDRKLILAIAPVEKRLWLHDSSMMMNHLIPITNFHNELMLHKRIRDPRIALKSNLLFDDLEQYSDEDLRSAFIAYNKVKKRVRIEPIQHKTPRSSRTLRNLFGKR